MIMAMTHEEAIAILKQEYVQDDGTKMLVFKAAANRKFRADEDEAFKAKAIEAFEMRANRHMGI